MSQNDMSIANASGAVVRADMNSALQALASLSAGTSAPSTTYQYQWWADTTNNLLKIRNEGNTAWVNVAEFTGTDFVPLTQSPVVAISTTTTIDASHNGRTLRVTASATLNLTAAATLADGWWCMIRNDHSAAVTLDANGAEQINGSATKSLDPGAGLILICTGSAFVTIDGAKNPTGSNLGSSGGRVFSGISGADFQFRRIVAGSNISVTENTNDVTIASTGVPSAAVGQSQLKTSTSEVSQSFGGGRLDTGFAGGDWNFWPVVRMSVSPEASDAWYLSLGDPTALASINTTYTNRISLLATTDGSSRTLFAQQRYITASPPYDWGDGELGGFAFLKIEKGSGRVLAGWTANDPPWAYNGPTRTKADAFLDPFGIEIGLWEALGKGTSVIPVISGRRTTESIDEARAAGRLARHLEELAHGDVIFERVNVERKMRDMPIIPHPFFNVDPAREVIVMLDPLSDFVSRLFTAGGRLPEGASILSLVHDGDILFDNEDLAPLQKRGGPSGVMQVGCRLR